MTEQELKKLKRYDLVKLLLDQKKENERLENENKELKKKLDERLLKMEESGSLAEAVLELNQVFESADSAARQYKASLQKAYYQIDSMKKETRTYCEELVEQAKTEANWYWDRIARRLEELGINPGELPEDVSKLELPKKEICQLNIEETSEFKTEDEEALEVLS